MEWRVKSRIAQAPVALLDLIAKLSRREGVVPRSKGQRSDAIASGTIAGLLDDLPLAEHPHGGAYRVTPPLTGQAAMMGFTICFLQALMLYCTVIGMSAPYSYARTGLNYDYFGTAYAALPLVTFWLVTLVDGGVRSEAPARRPSRERPGPSGAGPRGARAPDLSRSHLRQSMPNARSTDMRALECTKL